MPEDAPSRLRSNKTVLGHCEQSPCPRSRPRGGEKSHLKILVLNLVGTSTKLSTSRYQYSIVSLKLNARDFVVGKTDVKTDAKL